MEKVDQGKMLLKEGAVPVNECITGKDYFKTFKEFSEKVEQDYEHLTKFIIRKAQPLLGEGNRMQIKEAIRRHVGSRREDLLIYASSIATKLYELTAENFDPSTELWVFIEQVRNTFLFLARANKLTIPPPSNSSNSGCEDDSEGDSDSDSDSDADKEFWILNLKRSDASYFDENDHHDKYVEIERFSSKYGLYCVSHLQDVEFYDKDARICSGEGSVGFAAQAEGLGAFMTFLWYNYNDLSKRLPESTKALLHDIYVYIASKLRREVFEFIDKVEMNFGGDRVIFIYNKIMKPFGGRKPEVQEKEAEKEEKVAAPPAKRVKQEGEEKDAAPPAKRVKQEE